METIQAVLAGMKERLERVQAQVAGQLQEYSHLVRTQPTGTSHSDSAGEARGDTSQPAPFLLDVVLGSSTWQARNGSPANGEAPSDGKEADSDKAVDSTTPGVDSAEAAVVGDAMPVAGEISFGLRAENE